jgi:predicted ATPase/class 3 adenylate cyclase
MSETLQSASAPMPAGIITFLFTDVEGSTRLWELQPAAMREAMARHDGVIEATVAHSSGRVVRPRGEGDSRFAVFARATDAVAAARDIQQALAAEPWPTPRPLRVRMALHTGETDLRAGDYYGSDVNRCARLRAIAYGGQTLLSQSTHDLVRDALPEEVAVRDLGEHRLKDLQRAEHVYQLDVIGQSADFPPLHSVDAFPNNLPVQLTSFVGRVRELSEVKQWLDTTHLLTLTGPGGTGKTRLSLQVAAEVLDGYGDGAWLVELAPLSDPALLTQTVAAALGVREQPGRPILDMLTDYLRSKNLLLILDNCEHLIEACAQLADTLLRTCPHLRILTSSRESLGIAGETSYRVPSLSVPHWRQANAYEVILENDCVRLFVDRALAVQNRFRLTEKNADAVAQICSRLDGIPLAIELAAARVKVFSPEQIAARLDDRFRLLTGGSRTALPRQQTLRALIDWSYDMLPKAEQVLLRRLSVFAGGWTFEAAEGVCGGDDDVLDSLTHLVDKSLVTVDEQDQGARYRLLETIRQYARDKLLESGESAALRDRHLDFFVGFAEEAEPKLMSPEDLKWTIRLEPEHENIRAALEWGLDNHPDLALRLSGALGVFWNQKGFAGEGRGWLEAVLGRVESLPAAEGELARSRLEARGRALAGIAFELTALGDMTGARRYAEEGARILRELGDRRRLAFALLIVSLSARHLNDPVAALAAGRESVALLRALRDKWGLANVLGSFATVVASAGHDFGTARSYLDESIRLFDEVGAKRASASPLYGYGLTAYLQGDYERARAAYQECLSVSIENGIRPRANMARSGMADVAWQQRKYQEALKLYREAIAEWQQMGNPGGIARCLECIAFVFIDQARTEPQADRPVPSRRAARILGAAEALREQVNSPMTPFEQPEYDREVASLREELDETSLASAWAEGRALTMGQVIAQVFDKDD